MTKKTKTILFSVGAFVLLAALSAGVWFLTKKEPASEGNVLNVAWYDENGTEFTIDTIEEMREFAALSEYYDFEGQTIKLDADIIDNDGDAADWENEIPAHLWKPIKNFAGTFDGQGHTISGICSYGFVYVVRDGKTVFCKAGMFTDTKASCTIKDFRLVNSFFLSDFNEGVGSVASNGGGTFDSIYSNAIVLSYKESTGGIVGCLDAKGSHAITNCWFDGVLRVEGNVGHYAGGIVAMVGSTGGTCKVEHCLNTGALSSTLVNTGVNLGGIAGVIMTSGRVQMTDCLSVGKLSNDYGIAVGSVIGQVAGSASINDVYAVRESYKAIVGYKAGGTIGFPIEYTTRMLTGFGAYQWTTLDFDNYWSVVEDSTPVLKYFTNNSPSVEGIEKKYDTSWYEKGQTECVIMNAAQLYGFTILSRVTDFSGVTVKLGADIVVNEGDAATWADEEPEYSWNPISTGDYPFNGVFDGQMHSISGIWCKTNSNYSGLFSATTELSVIKNLKLVNSYFEFGGQSSGSISGRGRGNFDTIYSAAIIRGSNINLGGMVGQIPGDGGIVMNNCWFDGQVTNTSNSLSTRYTGGLVGVVLTDSVMKNCLNTGTVDATKFTTPNPNNVKNIVPLAGGLIGYIPTNKAMTIEGCLNVGKVKVNEVASIGYGSIAGYVDGSVKVSNTYAVADSSDLHSMIHGTAGELIVVDASILTGYGAYQRTLLDFDEYWAVVKTGTPILKSFAEEVPDLSGVQKLCDVSWYSPDKNVYVLDSLQDLHGFALLSYDTNFKGKTVKLAADIVVNSGYAGGWAQKAPQNKWIEIGNSNLPFAGTFDGGMHSISGIYVKTEDRFGGVFAKTTPTAVIKNVRLLNTYIEAEGADCGSIVGRGEGGVFDTIYSNAIVRCAGARVGGMFGQLYGDKITINNCWFDGRVIGTGNSTSARDTGGILGLYAAKTGSLTNCLNTGVVDATAYDYNQKTDGTSLIVPLAGGLIGQIWENVHVTVERSLNAGEVKVSQKASDGNIGFGAIYGWTDGNVKVVDAYATAESCKRVSSGSSSKQTGRIKQLATDTIKGYGAYRWTYLDFAKYWAVVLEGTPVLRSFAGSVPSLAGIEKMIDNSWYDPNKNEYVLKDAADLFGFAELSKETDFAGKTIKLGADIVVNKDMSNPSYDWTQIGSTGQPFAGTFDGGMHSISGIYLKTNDRFGGLFAETTTTAVIKNLRLLNSYIDAAGGDCGSIVGRGKGGTFDTIYSNATVICAGSRVGGLFGQLHGDKITINNCWFDGKVTGTGNALSARDTGGILGLYAAKNGSLTNCLNTGVVDATAYEYNQKTDGTTLIVPVAGGLIGQIWENVNVTVQSSLNTGAVKVSEKAAAGNVGFGAIYGWTDGIVKVVDTYATMESCKRVSSGPSASQTGVIRQVSANAIKGYDGYRWTVLDFTKYWAVVSGGTPVLRSFAGSTPSVAGISKMIDTSWYDASKKEFVLKDVADLFGFAELSKETDFAGKTVKLGADIVVNSDMSNPSYAWTQIGNTGKPFAGTFDGGMHSISGIYVKTDGRFGGLFAETTTTAAIKNVSLLDSYIDAAGGDCGGIVGRGKGGTFDTIYTNATVTSAGSRVGGLFGQLHGDKITVNNCWFDGKVTGTGNDLTARDTGGIVGLYAAKDGSLTNCLNTGVVDATAYDYNQKTDGTTLIVPVAGGFIGQIWENVHVTVESGLNTGAVKVSEKAATGNVGFGAIYGWADGTVTATNVYATAESCKRVSSGPSENLTGMIRQVAADAIKGYDGYQWTNLDFTEYWAVVVDDETTTDVDEAGTPILKSFATKVPSLEGKEKMVDVSWVNETAGTAEDPYILKDAADLFGFALLAQTDDFAGKTVKLGADIDLNPGWTADKEGGTGTTPTPWNSIGSTSKYFKGTFDGDGHTILGLYQTTASTSNVYLGLFGATGGVSTVKNFRLENSYIYTKGARVGSIAGIGDGNFEDIYSNAIIVTAGTNAGAIGGMIGYFDGEKSVTYSGLHFDGVVQGSAYHVGGILGRASHSADDVTLTIKDCWNSGSVLSTDVMVGGMVGLIDTAKASAAVDLTGCWNSGVVSSPGARGTLIGKIRNGTPAVNISDCLNSFVTPFNPIGSQETGTVTYQNVLDAGRSPAKVWNGSSATTVALSNVMGTAAEATLTPSGFDFADAWATRTDDVPVPKAFAAAASIWSAAGTAEDPYVLNTAADLLFFAVKSQTNNFEGKYVKLGADIDLNPGWTANEDGGTGATPTAWTTQIGSTSKYFKGTFDGDGHTIFGLYQTTASTSNVYLGLFAATSGVSTVKNFRLANSYIKTAGARVGSIAGNGDGNFENIYSNAIIVTEGTKSTAIGGMIGYFDGEKSVTYSNLHFDGTVTGSGYYVGGILGQASHGASGVTLTIENCRNSGTVYSSDVGTGSMVGLIETTVSSAVVNITGCWNDGNASAKNGVQGTFVGRSRGSGAPTVNVTNCLNSFVNVLNPVGSQVTGTVNVQQVLSARESDVKIWPASGAATSVAPSALTGAAAEAALTPYGFDFAGAWATRDGKLPVPKCFADAAG